MTACTGCRRFYRRLGFDERRPRRSGEAVEGIDGHLRQDITGVGGIGLQQIGHGLRVVPGGSVHGTGLVQQGRIVGKPRHNFSDRQRRG